MSIKPGQHHQYPCFKLAERAVSAGIRVDLSFLNLSATSFATSGCGTPRAKVAVAPTATLPVSLANVQAKGGVAPGQAGVVTVDAALASEGR